LVKLRLKRFGRRNSPFYRLTAIDIRSPRDGRAIEELGTFNPIEKDVAKQINFKADRVKHWLSVGAQPSETVGSLCKRAGIEVPKPAKEVKDRSKRKKAPRKVKAVQVDTPRAKPAAEQA
jgi:small subunit ribosomal protein S16